MRTAQSLLYELKAMIRLGENAPEIDALNIFSSASVE